MKHKRPEILKGSTHCKTTGCGKIYITVNTMDDKPFEVFLNMGKAGGCAAAQCESIGRLISYSLRIGGDITEIIKVIKGIRCHQPSEESLSCADAEAEILQYASSEKQESLLLPVQ
jgi:ribonucleoside-diphosphate reductase alpha chain